MTDSILGNELVFKYFGCHPAHNHYGEYGIKCRNEQAMKILEAMHQPIRKEERYLELNPYGETLEKIAENSNLDHCAHFDCLRLPDSFQPAREQK